MFRRFGDCIVVHSSIPVATASWGGLHHLFIAAVLAWYIGSDKLRLSDSAKTGLPKDLHLLAIWAGSPHSCTSHCREIITRGGLIAEQCSLSS